MKLWHKTLIATGLGISAICAEESAILRSSPTYDEHFSPYAGAENLLAIHNGFEDLENRYFAIAPVTMDEVKDTSKSPTFSMMGRVWAREAEEYLFWIPESVALIIFQHEVFGHGYRIRDLGPQYVRLKGYQFHLTSGLTKFNVTSKTTTSQMMAIAIGGVEADTVLANRIRMRWLQDGIDPRQYFVYYFSALDLTQYTLTLHSTPQSLNGGGNDMAQYLFYLNATYPDSPLNYQSLKTQSLVNFLDPFLCFALYSQLIHHSYGVPVTRIPMIHLGPVQYLPAVRFALTPFGPQYYLENFIVQGSTPTYVYFKWGRHGANTYYGLGIENRNLATWDNASFGFRLDLWRQPNVLFQPGAMPVYQMFSSKKPIPRLYSASVLTEKRTGAAASLIGAYGIFGSSAQLTMELGYKSEGYLPGEALRAAPILRGGFSQNF